MTRKPDVESVETPFSQTIAAFESAYSQWERNSFGSRLAKLKRDELTERSRNFALREVERWRFLFDQRQEKKRKRKGLPPGAPSDQSNGTREC